MVAVRGMGRGWELLERTLETSGQLAIRIAVVTVFALGALASSLGLDLLLGGFVAGVIARIALKGREVQVFESKLTAVGYGFFIPFFFVVSGIKFDLTALTDTPWRLLELPLFLGLFLVVRGGPALLLYRDVLDRRDRAALACSPQRSCRSSWRSPPSPWSRDTCARPRPPRWSAPASCRRRSCRSWACACEPAARRRLRRYGPSMLDRKLLGIYLNDHLAGATVGLELSRRALRSTRATSTATCSSGSPARSRRTARRSRP